MRRYHEELRKSLLSIAGAGELFGEFSFSRGFLSTNNDSKFLLRLDRWLTYPLSLSRQPPGNFHILDQSHAHLALAARRSKCVITCHDLMPVRDALKLSPVQTTTFRKGMLGYLVKGLQRADHIISDSQATRDDLINLIGIPEERITVIYLGRNELFRPAADEDQRHLEVSAVRSELEIPDDARIIFHVGTGSPVKNTSAILHALKLNPKRLFFIRAGMDLNADERVLLDSLGVGDRYRYAGAGLSDDKMAQLYRVADVFVFPSFWEGFGWPPIEAMASGTPVVCSKIGSLNEVVLDAALQVAPDDHVGLSAAICELLENLELRNDMVARGLRRASQFSWRETALQVREVYRSAFGEGLMNR